MEKQMNKIYVNTDSFDDISQMIEKHAGDTPFPPPEKIEEAFARMELYRDQGLVDDTWVKKNNERPAYTLDVIRDGSDKYIKALTKAIMAVTRGEYGYINYKGYKIYYSDKPHIKSTSLKDGHMEYFYWIRFLCDALSFLKTEEYHSEDERKAFLDPENALFEKTVALLDREIQELDEGKWIKKRKKLNVCDFKDYSSEGLRFKRIEWDEGIKSAFETFSYLIGDVVTRSEGCECTEEGFIVCADIIRRMVFFADYGKKTGMVKLEGLFRFEWEPKTEQDKYIKRCMEEFDQGGVPPDHLLDCWSLYYFLEDPKGWEAIAYILPIIALLEMCGNYEPDDVKDILFRMFFDRFPEDGYRERLEKLIEEDRAGAGKAGDSEDDQEDI